MIKKRLWIMLALIAVFGCTDTLTDPETPLFGRGGNGKKPKPGFELTDLQVVEAPHSEAPDRCGDTTYLCYRIVVHYTGTMNYLRVRARHIYPERLEPTIEKHWLATGFPLEDREYTILPTGDGETAIGYWQGQWTPLYWDNPMGPSQVQPAETLVDYAPVGESDVFALELLVNDHQGTRSLMSVQAEYPEVLVQFKGQSPAGSLYLGFDGFEEVIQGRKKNLQHYLAFWVHAFSSLDEQSLLTTADANFRILFTDPHGQRSMHAASGGTGADDVTIAGQRFRIWDPIVGCYEVQVIGVEGWAGTASHYDDRLLVWDPAQDLVGAAPLRIVYDGQSVTTTTVQGGCPVGGD